MTEQDAGEETAEEEWRFPLSDFDGDGDGADPAGSEVAVGDGEDATGSDGTDLGEADPDASDTIEAGDPTLEGAFFLLLGVAFALFVISRLVVG